MKYLWGLTLTLLLFSSLAQSATPEIRQKIGNIFTAPLLYKEKYYFVSTAGVLYESNKDLSEVNALYTGTRQTIGVMTLINDKLIWGDGLHTDLKATLHVFDLKTKTLLKNIELEGHINRAPIVHSGLIILPLGPSGIMALDLQTLTVKWKTDLFGTKKLHVDSNLLVVEDKVCGTSVGETKGLFCVQIKTGALTQFSQLMRDPKSDITLWKNHLVGFATEGDIARAKFDIPSDLFIYDVKADKIILVRSLEASATSLLASKKMKPLLRYQLETFCYSISTMERSFLWESILSPLSIILSEKRESIVELGSWENTCATKERKLD